MSNTNMLTSPSNQPAQLQAHQNYADVSGFHQLKQQAREDQASALKPVAAQFEAIFVQQLLQEARKVSFDDGWLDGNQGDFYKDWSDKQLAQDIAAKGTLGFADNIVKQLTPNTQGLAPTKSLEPFLQPVQEKTTQTEINSELLSATGPQVSSTEQALALRFAKQPESLLK